jgi:Ice-binding-like
MIEGGDLTLDALGDANSAWVFQMATTITVGGRAGEFLSRLVI